MGMFSGVGSFGRKLQSDLVLRTARGFYLVTACVSLGALLLAAIIAILAQASTLRFTVDQHVPAVQLRAAEPIAVSDVASRMTPPQALRFVPDPQVLNFAITEGQALGYFDAETPNQLAPYPDDFDIVGGDDAALFIFSRHQGNGRAGLRASARLAQQLNDTRANGAVQLSYTLRVIARDRAGQVSAPTEIMVRIDVAPPGSVTAPPAADPSLTDLQALAREIALVVDPQQTDVFYGALRSAVRTPDLCGVAETPNFVAQYRAAFEGLRDRLRRDNLDLFYRGVCDAWNAAEERAQARHASERAAADAILARNANQRMELEAHKRSARLIRNLAFGVAGTALAVFLIIALFLAFLAMEAHSKALRQAVEALAAQNSNSSGGERS